MSGSFVCVLLLLLLLLLLDSAEVVRGRVCEGDGEGGGGSVCGGEKRGGGAIRPLRERVSKGWAGTISKHSDLSSPL